MDAENHPDPFQDAMHDAAQRAVRVASCAVTAAEVYVHHQRAQARAVTERDDGIRRALNAQIRADRDAHRAGWAPALDPDWLRQAGLFQTARAWGAATPYADRSVPWYEPAAATAMRKCEERLRDLHPHAMARYDRLRGDGMGPAEAMRETAPLFTRPPRVHDASFIPHPVLDAGKGPDLAWAAAGDGPGGGEPDTAATAEAQERRGRQIIDALQDRAREQGREPLGEAEQRTVLEAITNLPPGVIHRVVQPDPGTGLARAEQNRAATAERVRTAGLDPASGPKTTPDAGERTGNLTGARDAAATAAAASARAARAVRPWERDFPLPIREVVASAESVGAAATSARPARAAAQNPPHRGGPHP